MTNILLLPEMSGSLSITNNGDWRQAIQFVANGTTTPIDLTGITFRSQVRSMAGSSVVLLDLSTVDGTLVVDHANGKLSWAVPAAALASLSGAYVTDIIAVGDGITRNLCPTPIALTVVVGVTR